MNAMAFDVQLHGLLCRCMCVCVCVCVWVVRFRYEDFVRAHVCVGTVSLGGVSKTPAGIPCAVELVWFRHVPVSDFASLVERERERVRRETRLCLLELCGFRISCRRRL
ncbi:hypothetical protein KC19_2G243200 [Ceratodon purpureus]|uniref:Uncharacterized protein n=1 Tax=Ceratodon purpureus TaxID=3225 RepID=A0A8T0IZN9_CERPU|nr:hypothetical protein KC19_2G243200 [Ceratodon purpureus]